MNTCKNYGDAERVLITPGNSKVTVFYKDGRRVHENVSVFFTLLLKDMQSVALALESNTVEIPELSKDLSAILKRPD